MAPIPSKGPVLIAFMQQNKWRKITILTSSERNWFEAGLALEKQLQTAGIEVLMPGAFEPGNLKGAALSEIRRYGVRIVLMLSWGADSQALAVRSQRESMTSGWAWLVSYKVLSVPAMAGWLWFRPFLVSNVQAFARKVSEYTKSHFDLTVSPDLVDIAYSVALHDAIVLYAHASTKVLSKRGDLRDGEAVTAALRNTSFTGVGGTVVALDSRGDRIESYEVMNYVLEADNVIRSVAFGRFNSTHGQYKAYGPPVVWPGDTLEVPTDYVSAER